MAEFMEGHWSYTYSLHKTVFHSRLLSIIYFHILLSEAMSAFQSPRAIGIQFPEEAATQNRPAAFPFLPHLGAQVERCQAWKWHNSLTPVKTSHFRYRMQISSRPALLCRQFRLMKDWKRFALERTLSTVQPSGAEQQAVATLGGSQVSLLTSKHCEDQQKFQ